LQKPYLGCFETNSQNTNQYNHNPGNLKFFRYVVLSFSDRSYQQEFASVTYQELKVKY